MDLLRFSVKWLCSNMEVSQSKHDVQILSHFLNLEKMLPVGNFESPLSMYDLSYCTPSKVSKESYGSEPQNHDLLGFWVGRWQRGAFLKHGSTAEQYKQKHTHLNDDKWCHFCCNLIFSLASKLAVRERLPLFLFKIANSSATTN